MKGDEKVKVIDKIKNTLVSIKNSVKRFPITIGVSIVLVISLIYLNEVGSHINIEKREVLRRVNMVIGLGLPLSLCIGLIKERLLEKEKYKGILFYLVGIIVLVLYYFFLLKDFDMVSITRYLGSILFLILAFYYIPWMGKGKSYEDYVIKVFSSFFLTIIYSFVLYFGISAILITIDKLFDVYIQSKIYYYMFLVVAIIFGLSLFLSRIPTSEEKFENYIYPKSLKILLLYIVIPLITIYTAILYAYFAKILITRQWPKGLVSHLVLWYSTLSVGVIFFITPVENKWGKFFKTWFPKLVLPILFMMFVSIGIRIRQYGITENRYYVLALGLWVMGIMIYFSGKKPIKNIVVPISLSIVILNSIFGPLSSYSLSELSQNKRFEKILLRNEMLVHGEIQKKPDIPVEDKEEISNIITYFSNNHSLADIKYLPMDFKIADMEDIIGFPYATPYYPGAESYFYYSVNLWQEPLVIKDYDYYININSWNNKIIIVDNMDISYDKSNNTLTLIEGEKILFSKNITDYIEKIHEIKGSNPKNMSEIKLKDMTFEEENENVKVKIVFINSSGRIEGKDKLILENMECILLVHKKK